jgi:ribonuclease HII
VIGVDEAGRGPLAGPVVAAAVTVSYNLKLGTCNSKKKHSKVSSFKLQVSRDFKDSKKLTPKKREELYKILTNHPQIEWAIGKVGPRVIDRINILEATKLAMQRAVKNLTRKLVSSPQFYHSSHSAISYDRTLLPNEVFLLLDGNFKIKSSFPQKSIIKADEKISSCQIASIIAKVKRDNIMKREDKKHPQYGFAKHKGYPTKFHKDQLKKHGLSAIHRKTFTPCKNRPK